MRLYCKVPKPYLGCEACQQHGCPYCYEYVEVNPANALCYCFDCGTVATERCYKSKFHQTERFVRTRDKC